MPTSSWSSTLTILFLVSSWIRIAGAQRFTAVHRSTSLKRSGTNFLPSHGEQMLSYIDESLATATLRLEPKLPLLLLEDVDEHLKNITCVDFTMTLEFKDLDSFSIAISAWSRNLAFALVTNHDGCQTVDEHEARIITQIIIEHWSNTLHLIGKPSSLQAITHRIKVDFGIHDRSSSHDRMKLARQEQATSTDIAIASLPATNTFNYQSPTASATGSSLSADLSFQRINTTLLPPDSSIVQYLPYASVPENMNLSCRNCTLTGNIKLSAGGFSINSYVPTAIDDFFSDGYLEFDATGISAYMDFDFSFLPGFSVLQFTAQLPSIPLGAIEIAGLLKLGLVLDLTFPSEVTLNSPVTFQTGFSLSAPPLAKIYLNMSQPDSSYTTGFSQSTLHALPFNADMQNLSMDFSTGFKPQLVLGVAMASTEFEASVGGGIGVYLDLPTLSTTLSIVDNVNDRCESTTTHSRNGLIHIEPSVTFDAGAQWDLFVEVLDIEYERGQAKNLLSNTITLPTQCLAWDAKASSLVNAASVKLSSFSSASGAGGTSTGSASATKNAQHTVAWSYRAWLVAWIAIAVVIC